MLNEGDNIGPIKYQIPVNDKWNEVNYEGLYYYFRK